MVFHWSSLPKSLLSIIFQLISAPHLPYPAELLTAASRFQTQRTGLYIHQTSIQDAQRTEGHLKGQLQQSRLNRQATIGWNTDRGSKVPTQTMHKFFRQSTQNYCTCGSSRLIIHWYGYCNLNIYIYMHTHRYTTSPVKVQRCFCGVLPSEQLKCLSGFYQKLAWNVSFGLIWVLVVLPVGAYTSIVSYRRRGCLLVYIV